ncbi:MAG: alpha/beta hydrolase family protein [Rikenellaceae bacterium]|jgi:dienelactone hydrolase|nr:alpha/beta hydrolase family protein [Rikenellaceae bacterium]
MVKKFFCFFAGVQLIAGIATAQEKRERYEIEFGTPVYYKEILQTLTFPFSWQKAGQYMSYDAWNRMATGKMMELMAPMPPDVPLDCKIVDTEQRDGYKAHKIEFNISGWARVPAYLLVPDIALRIPQGGEKLPGLVMLHDHGAQFYIGKEKMVRPFDVEPEVAEKARAWIDRLYSGRYVGDDYARQGYVVLSVDALFWGERGRKEGVLYDGQQALESNFMQIGMSWTGMIVHDDMRSVDLLASLPYVDPARIGAVGFSMGSYRAWMLTALKKEVAAGVAICWMNTTELLMTPNNNQLKGGSAYSMLVPGMANWLDYPHVASLACPRALLLFNGRQDKLFPVEGVESCYAQMREVWHSQNADDKLVTELRDTPHIFNADMQAEVNVFLAKHLKAK